MTQLVALFAGPARDNGFYESGLRGALAACDELGLDFRFEEGFGPKAEALIEAARTAARAQPEYLLVHGGSSDVAVETVAPEFPATRFLSTHGTRAGSNFSAFNIRQPQSAFLAGALAALLTRTGVVGHLSGIRIAPGLHARAAWAQGVHHVNPDVRIVTCFCGTQDDNAVSHRHARAVLGEGADVLYTMLNSGRTGAIDACRETGARQIGNVIDWCALHPDVFIASAIADNGRGVLQWLRDAHSGRLSTGEVRSLGMEEPEAVRLAMAPGVPQAARERIESLAQAVVQGHIVLRTEYAGPEFAPLV